MTIPILNRTAAEIAAAAFFEKFPKVEPLGGKTTSLGFSYYFRSAFPLPTGLETTLEEEMRQIVRENRPIRILEMVPLRARELLLKEGLASRAEIVADESLVKVVQIGRFYNLSSGPYLTSTSQLQAFKLWPITQIEDQTFRLSGCAFPSKKELKQFLNRLRDYPEVGHERVGIEKSLWHFLDGRVIWLPAGLKMRSDLIEVIRTNLFQNACEICLFGYANRISMHALLLQEMGKEGVAEIYLEPDLPLDPETGLFAGDAGTLIRVSLGVFDGRWKEKALSSLQSIGNTLRILGLHHRLRISGQRRSGNDEQALFQAVESLGLEVEVVAEETGDPRLDFLVKDRLKREWPAFSLELAVICVIITASVERLVALLLENKPSTK